MKDRNKLMKAVTLGLLVAASGLWLTHRARAFTLVDKPLSFGTVGLASGQTAQLNVLNLGQDTIQVSLDIADSEGRMLKQSVEMIDPGHSASLDLPFSTDVDRGRIGVHASVHGASSGGALPIATFEVFDTATGRTSFSISSGGDKAI